METRMDPPAPKILAVEDEADIRSFIKELVESQDMAFRGAATGAEGVQAARDWEPDVVLLDMNLPDTTGLEVLKGIRSGQGDRFLPVIFLTSEKGVQTKVRSLGLGADDYLTKPVSPLELAARLKVHLRTKRLQEELREKNERLHELESLRKSLSQFIVHDLKNVLSPLELSLRMGRAEIKEGSAPAGQLEKLLSIASNNAAQMRSMIQDMLTVDKLEENKLPLDPKPLDAGSLLEECRSQIQGYAESRQANLTFRPPARPARVLADKDLILRVLSNLAGNAVKFASHKNREVVISASADAAKKECVFSVQDNGMGIPKEQLERVFDKFFQVRSEQSNPVPGTGLGLTFCKLVVEAHNGRIWAESESGKGSRFSFSLKVV